MGLISKVMFWRRRKPVVPVVRLAGVITQSSRLGQRRLSLEAVEPQLKKAFSIKRAKAVALIINSPGGSPVQSSLIGQSVRDLASRADVPVLAFCEDVAASGGYWLAARVRMKSLPILHLLLVLLGWFQPGLDSIRQLLKWVLSGGSTQLAKQK